MLPLASQFVFQRYEMKFLLDEPQYQALLPILERHMEPGSYGEYTICNLYFDTDDFRVIRASIEKPVYKEKLRVRSYGIPGHSDECFVEIKKKFKGVVYKRRVAISVQGSQAWLDRGVKPTDYGQIHREIDWFLAHYACAPKVYLAYDRTELSGRDDPDLRVTFDRGIRFRTDDVKLTSGDRGEQLLRPGLRVMEVKIPGAMPLWMSSAFDRLGIRKTSFSKYGKVYERILRDPNSKLGDVFCA